MLPLNRWLILIVKLNVLGLKAIDSIKKSKWFSSQSSLEAFKKYIWIYKEQKGHPRFIRLPKKKKKKKKRKNSYVWMGKWWLLTFFELYTVHVKKLGLFFKQNCLDKDTSVLLKVKMFKQVHKLSIQTMVLTF